MESGGTCYAYRKQVRFAPFPPLKVTAEQYLSSPSLLASLIDHTLLKPDAVEADIGTLCSQAQMSKFASVCINPYWIPFAAAALAGSSVKVCTVIGFPLGANDPATKIFEAKSALASGAAELDMVINIGALKSGKLDVVEKEITDLADIAHGSGALLKVILETCLLSEEEIVSGCQMAVRSRADFVKTSTGFSSGGATEAHVSLMRQTVGAATGVKASGGVRSLEALVRMVRAGANRIGTSSGVQILAEYSSGAQQDAAGGY
jgi:deoxyribose-phosphate aldolase